MTKLVPETGGGRLFNGVTDQWTWGEKQIRRNTKKVLSISTNTAWIAFQAVKKLFMEFTVKYTVFFHGRNRHTKLYSAMLISKFSSNLQQQAHSSSNCSLIVFVQLKFLRKICETFSAVNQIFFLLIIFVLFISTGTRFNELKVITKRMS